MSDQWYYRVRGREHGPCSAEQLQALAAQGKLKPDHLVRQGAQGQWVSASRVAGLFRRGGASAVATANSAPAGTAPSADPPVRSGPQAAPDLGPKVGAVATVAGRLDAGGTSVLGSRSDQPRPQPKPIGVMVVAFICAMAGLALIRFPILPLVFGGAAALLSLRGLAAAFRHSLTFGGIGLVGLLVSLSVCGIGGYVTLHAGSPVVVLKKMLGIEEFRQQEPPDKWYDAATKKVAAGGVFVRVASVTIESLRSTVGAEMASSAGMEATAEYMFVELRLENKAKNTTANYLSWSEEIVTGAAVPLLTDQQGTQYKAVSFGDFQLPGQSGATSIAYGEAVSDLIVFEPPAEPFAFFKLTLPLSALNKSGNIQFQIPQSMVVQAPYTPPPPDDGPTTTPAEESARPAPEPKKRNPLETIEITREPEDDARESRGSRVEGREPESE